MPTRSISTGFLKSAAQPKKLEWILLISIAVVLFTSHTYNDIVITTRHGINLWNALFDGRIFDFYSYNSQAVSGNVIYTAPQNASYDFASYIVFALWNFPLWVMEKFFKVDVMNSIWCLMWSKAMLVFFLGLSAKIMHKICLEMKMNENLSRWCVFSYLSSAFVLSSLFIMSQYDIISLSFMLIGLLMYFKEKKGRFLLWFAVAISFKFFALFIFVPLILLFEKRILHIFKYFIAGISITVLFKLLFLHDVATKSSGTFQLDMLKNLAKNSLPLSNGNISIFFLLTALLYIFCYFKNIRDLEELYKFGVYISFLAFAIFFASVYTFPYWIILITPFTSLLIFQNYNKIRINFLVEIAMTTSFICAQMISFFWCFGIKTIEPMILPKIFVKVSLLPQVFSIEYLLNGKFSTIKGALPILLTLFVACIIALAVINFPRSNKDSGNCEKEYNEVGFRDLIFSRLLISGGICLIPIIGYISSVFYYWI